MKLTPKQRSAVLATCGGRCAYCGQQLGAKWHADHIEPIMRKWKWFYNEKKNRHETRATGECWAPENDRLDNFLPACVPCNINKGPLQLETWRKALEQGIASVRRNNSTFRHCERFGRIVEVTGPIVFYFETLTAETCEVKDAD